MKIKKGLALILALAMIITLMPTMAFATTKPNVPSVVNVAAESKMPDVSFTLETNDVWRAGDPQHMRLELANAEWTGDDPTDVVIVRGEDNKNTNNGVFESIITDATAAEGEGEVPITVEAVLSTRSTSNTIEFDISSVKYDLPKGTVITFTFANEIMTSGSEDGAVELTIDGEGTQISDATITIANVVASNTTATVKGTVKTFPRGYVLGEDIDTSLEIRESTVNALEKGSVQKIRLTLPAGVRWVDEKVGDKVVKPFTISGGLVDQVTNLDYELSTDKRTVTYTFTVASEINKTDVLSITPNIYIEKDAAAGDIALSLVGTQATKIENGEKIDVATVTDADDLVIARYGNESVEVSTVEEVPTIISGYVETPKDKNFTISVTLTEDMVDSLTDGRYVDFDLPEEVQICGQIKAKVNKDSQAKVMSGVSIEGIEGNPENGTKIDNNKDIFTSDDTSGFEFCVPSGLGSVVHNNDWDADKANTITFEIPVTVEAGFTGDITMNVTGSKAGVEDTELVVATAEAPITVETQTTNVKNGVQTQVVADITLTENYAGYFDDETDKDTIVLDIDTLGLSKSMVFESCDSIEVTDGNLEINEKASGVEKDGDNPYIAIVIDRESTTASTIELKGLTLTLNRTLPEGGYDLKVRGGAIVQNSQYNDGEFSGTAVTVEDYVVITTPAENAGINATFTDGQASYTLNGQTVTMDVAPYIDSNNRMLVPIRYAANAMGVSDDNIQWNSYTQTGTISGAMGVVRVTVGSTNLITSNGTITMDTVAVNTNNRIYVPVRYIANALGASVSWDPATRTATFS